MEAEPEKSSPEDREKPRPAQGGVGLKVMGCSVFGLLNWAGTKFIWDHFNSLSFPTLMNSS